MRRLPHPRTDLPRVVVTTDPELDDLNSMVRMGNVSTEGEMDEHSAGALLIADLLRKIAETLADYIRPHWRRPLPDALPARSAHRRLTPA